MRIGIDFDDTIAASVEAFLVWHNREYGTNYVVTDILHQRLSIALGIDKEIVRPRLDLFYTVEKAHHISPIDGAVAAIDELKAAGHELYLVTARSDGDVEATELWLDMHFPDTFKDMRYGNSRAEDPTMRRLKSDMCRELGVELLVDDHMNNVLDCAPLGIKVLMLDRPWNQGELPPGAERVHTWEEVVEKIERLAA